MNPKRGSGWVRFNGVTISNVIVSADTFVDTALNDGYVGRNRCYARLVALMSRGFRTESRMILRQIILSKRRLSETQVMTP
jgi:hypothetical protein